MTFCISNCLKNAMRLWFPLLIIFHFSIAFSAPIQHAAAEPSPVYHLTVLFTNDSHGHPVKFSSHSVPDVGGLPARATVVKEIRKSEQNVLLLDAGDINTGQSVSNFFKAKPDILGYNYLGYDAMALGNHEFDHPIHVLREQMDLAQFPFLSANIRTLDGKLLAIPYLIKGFPGFKAAVFGITGTETRMSADPDHVRDLIFDDEVMVAKKLVPYLKERADVIIALTHLGIYDDENRGSRRLAIQVPGIDLIVDGHTHSRLEAPVIIDRPGSGPPTLIVHAWQWGLVLGRIDLSIQDKEVIDYRMEMIPINLKRIKKGPDGSKTFEYVGKPIAEDPELLSLLQPYADKVHRFLSETIGYAQGPFDNEGGRYRETALGDLVADAMRWYLRRFEPDFALTNSGAIREGISEGPISRETIYDTLPFDSSLVFMNLKGAQVEALFDFIGTIAPGDGAFPQVSHGINFTMDLKRKTCKNVLINGKPIDPDRSYGVVTNSYLARGGDGYAVFTGAKDQFDASVFMRGAMTDYIRGFKENLVPRVHGRIKVLH